MKMISGSGGGKGGGTPRTPVETPDSLHSHSYATILDLLSEGEVAGPAGATLAQSVYLDSTPIENSDGTKNFTGVEMDHRVGTQDQEYIQGFPSVESTFAIGVEFKSDLPWTRAITNLQLSAVRVMLSIPTLMKVDETNGDRGGYRVEYRILLSTDGGAFEPILAAAFDGKTTTGFKRTHRIELPPAFSTGWIVRVTRVTPNSTTQAIQDVTLVDSITEVIDAKLRYPMSSIVGIKIDAKQFSSIPGRAYRWKGRIIRVPINYDPESRTYIGVWDGTFKFAYTNNPAWVFYDIVLNDRYGLGRMVPQNWVDRYTLYQIGAYCDQLVSDGNGGTEPRFTCNIYLQRRADALRVLQDIAAIFRGMAYWGSGQVFASADMPSDPVYQYTNAKVLNGRFEYTGSPITQRKTVALVSWNDMADFGRSKVEVVENEEGMLRYGIQKVEAAPLGCTSRSQAQRIGNYLLITSLMDTGGVGFSVGLDGVIPQPGNIIKIADKHRAGRHIGGLMSEVDIDHVVLDRDVDVPSSSTITMTTTAGGLVQRAISSIVGRSVYFSGALDVAPLLQGQWTVDSPDLSTQYFRVLSIREVGGIEYQIRAVASNPGKYTAIDNGTRLEPLPVSVIPPRVQDPPTNVEIDGFEVINQGIARHNATIKWDAAANAVEYEIEWRRDDFEWVRGGRTASLSLELTDVYAGEYRVRVRALNATEVPSEWALGGPTILTGSVGVPPTVTFLTTTGVVMGIKLEWGYPSELNTFERVQINASRTNVFNDSILLTDRAYPATDYLLQGLGYSTEMWFWIRLVDKNGENGPWYPPQGGPGRYGKPTQDPATILSYLEQQINSSHLAPGLIAEIQSGISEGLAGELAEIAGLVGIVDAKIANELIVRANADTALASTQTTLAAQINDAIAATTAETSARVTQYGAISTQYTALATQVGSNSSAITTEATARTNADAAIASSVTNLATRMGTAESNISVTASTVATLNGELTSTYQIKTQVRSDGRVVQSGIALGAAIGQDGSPRSEIILMADTIAFTTALNGALHAPFIFDVVNDTAFLANAYIQNLAVDTIKIADGAVTVPVSVLTTWQAPGTGSAYDIAYATITNSAPFDMQVTGLVTAKQNFPSGPRNWRWWIYSTDGYLYNGPDGGAYADSIAFQFADTVPAGTSRTYILSWQGQSGMDVFNRTVTLLGTKR